MQASRNFRVGIGRFRPEHEQREEDSLNGYFITTIERWSAKNQAEDPYTYGDLDPDKGIPPRLAAELIDDDDVEDLLLQAQFDNSVEPESEQDDNGYSEMANLAVDEFLARTERSELEARLARRLEERLAGNQALVLAGISPKARDLQIATLNDRLAGTPAELARERAELRRKAAALAPHNLTEVIGEPPARGRS